jgi:periplasmic protein TonB
VFGVVSRKSVVAAGCVTLGVHAAVVWGLFTPRLTVPPAPTPIVLQGVLIPALKPESIAPSAPPQPPKKPAVTPSEPSFVREAPRRAQKTPRAKPVSTASTRPAVPKVAPSSVPAPTVSKPAMPAATPSAAVSSPVVPPRVDAARLDHPKPEYPRLSRKRGEQGQVMLEVLIRVDGTVGNVRVKSSSGFMRLDESARNAVMQWHYIPASQGGKPIEFWYLQPIVFALDR